MYKKDNGFTLLEALIYASLAAVIGGILVTSFVSTSKTIVKQNTSVSQGVSLNDSMTNITEVIKQASNVATNYDTGSVIYTTSANTLVLAIPTLNAQGQVVSNTFDYAVITKDSSDNNVLRKMVFPNGSSSRVSENKVLSRSLSIITFEYLDASSNGAPPASAVRIRVNLKLTDSLGTSQKESSASSTINLKNL